MTKLVPVDFDPFAGEDAPATQDTSNLKLTPVDGNPFADEDEAALVAAHNRRNPNAPVESLPDRSGILGRAQELGMGMLNAVRDQFPQDMARIARGFTGGTPGDDSYFSKVIDEQQRDMEGRLPSKQVVNMDTLAESLAQGPASIATSLATGVAGGMIGGKVGAVAGSAGGPVGAGAGATIGAMVGAGAMSGAAFYNLAKDQFLDEMYQKAQKANPNLTQDDWKALSEALDADATEFGLWEAGPEAVSQFFTAGLVKGVGGKVLSKMFPGAAGGIARVGENAIARASAKLAAEVGEEEVTEGITFMGQEGIRQRAGLREDAPTLREFANTQAGPVAVGSVLQIGGMGAAERAAAWRNNLKGGTFVDETVQPDVAQAQPVVVRPEPVVIPTGKTIDLTALPSGNQFALPEGTGAMPHGTDATGLAPIPTMADMPSGPTIAMQPTLALPQTATDAPAGMWPGGRSQLSYPYGGGIRNDIAGVAPEEVMPVGGANDKHKALIAEALNSGKEVPIDVLGAYGMAYPMAQEQTLADEVAALPSMDDGDPLAPVASSPVDPVEDAPVAPPADLARQAFANGEAVQLEDLERFANDGHQWAVDAIFAPVQNMITEEQYASESAYAAADAKNEAEASLVGHVRGRLDGAKLRDDYPNAYKELVRVYGPGFFRSGAKGGVAIDEIADELKTRGTIGADQGGDELLQKLIDYGNAKKEQRAAPSPAQTTAVDVDDPFANSPEPAAPETSTSTGGFGFKPISDKAFVVTGDTKPIKDQLKAAGGKWNPKHKGWMFSNKRKDQVRGILVAIGGQKNEQREIKPSPLDAFEQKGMEPWQVTQTEWLDIMRGHHEALGEESRPEVEYKEYHRSVVKDAIEQGRRVPDSVLMGYPEFTTLAGVGQSNSEQPASESVKKGVVGGRLSSGEVVLTATGRKTSPFPKIDISGERKAANTLKRVDRWLIQNAIDEADSRGDDFAKEQFQAALDRPQQADKDAAEYYLFDKDFIQKPAPRFLKPLINAVSPENVESLNRGDVVTSGDGRQFAVWDVRHGVLTAHPIVDGKPSISADTIVKFNIDDRAKARNEEYRSDTLYFSGQKAQPAQEAAPVEPVQAQEEYGITLDEARAALADMKTELRAQGQESQVHDDRLVERVRKFERLVSELEQGNDQAELTALPEVGRQEAALVEKARAGNGLAFGKTKMVGAKRAIKKAKELFSGDKRVRFSGGGMHIDRGEYTAVFGADGTMSVIIKGATDKNPEAKTPEAEVKVEAKPEVKQETKASGQYGTPEKPDVVALSKYFADKLYFGDSYSTIGKARSDVAAMIGGKVEPGTPLVKAVDEAVELGVVRAARKIIDEVRSKGYFEKTKEGELERALFEDLVALYGQQPNLGSRTSTSVAQQAYSTPAPLAFLASHLAGITAETRVYEPTAGNGMLLIEADTQNAVANELNPDRAESLRSLGFDVTENDAAASLPDGKFDVVIANPPFGRVRDDNGDSKTWTVGDFTTSELDHAIVMQSLQSLQPNGRAVLIIGGKQGDEKTRADKYHAGPQRRFYAELFDNYKVVDHFTVDGKLYARQGAGYPIDFIVIEGRGKTEGRKFPAAQLPRIYTSFDQIKELINDRPTISKQDLGTAERVASADAAPAGRVGERGDAGRYSVSDRTQAEGTDSGGGRSEGVGSVSPERVGERGADRPVSGQKGADQGKRVGGGEPSGEARSSIKTSGNVGRGEERLPAEAQRDTGRTGDVSKPEPDGLGKRRPSAAPTVKQSGTSLQDPYTPKSGSTSMGTLVPKNMAGPLSRALGKLADKHKGDIDGYVANELGYSRKELEEYFAGEQVDAIALAIDNIEAGNGFIIGDQTGIGKGRVNAAIIRYANRKGLTPVFVTMKPDLYADMIRDLNDIGVKDFNPLPTNAGLTGDKSIPLPDGRTLKTKTGAAHEAAMRKAMEDGVKGYDAVFTTYDQLNSVKGKDTFRREFMRGIAHNAVFILDESHNAGGGSGGARKKKDAAATRAEFVREILAASPHGTFYSSATYAKRPDVMSLYFKTDMRHAVDDIGQLAEAISAGGIPLQQVVAAQLTESGQYIRRERSFEGASVEVTHAKADLQNAEQSATIMRSILAFDNMKQNAMKEMKKDARGDGEDIADSNAVGEKGANSTNFTSVMHNLIGQSLLAMKADAAVEETIAAVKRGEKPVITLANTMGSFIKEYVDNNELKPGDAVDLSFKDLFVRYLEKTRMLTKRDSRGKIIEQRMLTDDELGPDGVSAYKDALAQINASKFSDIPVSPIDYITHKLEAEGIRVGEITGRTATLDYSAGVEPTYSVRKTSPAQNIATMRGFNGGDIDVMILNQSGSTGISLHSSSTFADQRRRRMIIVQPELNIDVFMQTLGRVFRTGQVNPPAYSLLTSDIPAEKRPAAVLGKKMAGLNANTTASRKTDTTFKNIPDFLNEYGDLVTAQIMEDEPELHAAMGSPLKAGEDGGLDREDAVRKITGRIPLLTLAEQQRIYERIETEYADLVAQLEATGSSTLEAKTLQLDARLLSEDVLTPAKEEAGTDSPFAKESKLAQFDVKSQGKPFTPDQVREMIAKGRESATDLEQLRKDTVEWLQKKLSTIENEDSREALKTRAEDQFRRVYQTLQTFKPGTPVGLNLKEESFLGVVTKAEYRGTGSPSAPSAWRLTVALADAARQITLPVSKLQFGYGEDIGLGQAAIREMRSTSLEAMLEKFAKAQEARREKRLIAYGNVLAAYAAVNGRGQVIQFEDKDGNVQPGIMFSKDADAKMLLGSADVAFPGFKEIDQFFKTTDGKGIVKSADGNMSIVMDGSRYKFSVPASKAKGAQFFLNGKLIDAAGRDFVKSGNQMVVTVHDDQAKAMIGVLREQGFGLVAGSHTEEARHVLGIDKYFRPQYARGENTSGLDAKEVTSLAKPLLDLLTDSTRVNIVQSVADLPEGLRKKMVRDNAENVLGAYYGGTNYLIADNIPTAEDVMFVLKHELFHDGMRRMRERYASKYGRDEAVKRMNHFLDLAFAANKKSIMKLANAYRQDFPDLSDANNRRGLTEEWLGNRAYDNAPKWFDRYVAAIRRFIRDVANRLGVKLQFSDAELRDFIRRVQAETGDYGGDGRDAYLRAFHGSPHRFDKFTLDAIGSGEGEQAFGWGLYFAGKKEVAEWYRENLSGGGGLAASLWRGTTKKDALRVARESAALYKSMGPEYAKKAQDYRDAAKMIREAKSIDELPKSGQLYEVDIPEDDVMLHWDKPLSEQPENVRAALGGLSWWQNMLAEQEQINEQAGYQYLDRENRLTGEHLYHGLQLSLGGDREASVSLNSLGIKGIKYLDGTSRGAGDGSYNYVIFDDAAVEIAKTYYARPEGMPSAQDVAKVVDGFETGDIGELGPLLRLPHWLAKKVPSLRSVVDRQFEREERRSSSLSKSIESIPELFGGDRIKGKDRKQLLDFLWKWDGKNVKMLDETPKFVVAEQRGNRLLLKKNEEWDKTYAEWVKSEGLTGQVAAAAISVRKALDDAFVRGYNRLALMAETPDTMLEEMRSLFMHLDNYMPHSRTGAYGVAVYDKDGEALYREHFDAPSKAVAKIRADKRLKELRKEFPQAARFWAGVNKGMPEEIYEQFLSMDAMEKMLFTAVDNAVDDKAVAADLKKGITMAASDEFKARGWLSHSIGRKNVPGFERENVERVLFDYFAGHHGFLEKVDAARDMASALKKIDPKTRPNEHAYVVQYVKDMLRNSDKIDRVVGNIKALAFVWYLGGVIKTAAVNATQNIVSGAPTLGLWTKGSSHVRIFDAAMRSVVKDRLSEDEQRLIKELHENGLTQANLIREVQGRVSGKFGSVGNKVISALGWPMAAAERFNRVSLALAAYRAARSGALNDKARSEFGIAGKADHEKAKSFAEAIVRDAHFVYGKSNLPQPLRSSKAGRVASAAYTFRSFNHNMLEMWANALVRHGWQDGGKAILSSMAGTMVLGGLRAAPFFATSMALMNWLAPMFGGTGDDDWLEKIAKMLPKAEWMRDMILFGVPSLAGVDIGGSLRLEAPMVDRNAKYRHGDILGDMVGEALGIPYALVQSVGRAKSAVEAGAPARAVEEIAPVALKNAMAAYRLATEGAHSITGTPIKDPLTQQPKTLSSTEAVFKALGFQAVSQTKASLTQNAVDRTDAVRADKAKLLANRIANAMRDNNVDAVKANLRAWKDWNAKAKSDDKPSLLILPQDMKARLRARLAERKTSPRQALRIMQMIDAYGK